MASEVTLTAIYESVEDGWTQARISEIPEVITAAPTREDAEILLRDALLEYLSTLGQSLVQPKQLRGDRIQIDDPCLVALRCRFEDVPRPVVDLGPGRPRLWLRSEIDRWARPRHKTKGGVGSSGQAAS